MDRLTLEQRRKNMQAVKSKNSKIEIILRKALWAEGYRYRLCYKRLPGKPDIVLVSNKIAIFCDSEFWHGYNWTSKKKEIKSNKKFWIKKIESNIERDKKVNRTLKKNGWKVLRFWGNDIINKTNSCIKKIDAAFMQQ